MPEGSVAMPTAERACLATLPSGMPVEIEMIVEVEG